MGGKEVFFLVSSILGGLALFIYGMSLMTDSMREAAGSRLRGILSRATDNRLSGVSLGTLSGFLVHSSASTVMLVGFVNAGLMSLPQSIAPMLGANIGTTLSMQVISFKLDQYCFFAIALGFILQMVAPQPRLQQLGKILMGFGMIFLGMKVMKEAIQPYRAVLKPILMHMDGSHIGGMLLGVGMATLLTGIIQSSGATIGMCYALIAAGVFTRLEQVYPIVLGAHIGTCATALLGSIGTHIEARRTAFAHLFFNIGNVILAILAAPFFFWLVPLTAQDLIHQTANLHTLVMVIATLLLLPFIPAYARLVSFVVRSKEPPPEPSHLDENLLDRPEKAIVAVIQELHRLASLAKSSFDQLGEIMLMQFKGGNIQKIRSNEKVINEIKLAMKDYLELMTQHYLSRRQAMLIQHLDQCVIAIERIGDHIDAITDLSVKRAKAPTARFDRETIERLFKLYQAASKVLELVIASFNAELKDFSQIAHEILEARDAYAELSFQTIDFMTEKVTGQRVPPLVGMFFSEYISFLNRIVRHSKLIALAQSQPQFWIKRKKLDRIVDMAPKYTPPEPLDPQELLAQFQKDRYM